MEKFGQVLDLIPKAETVEKLTAICTVCKRDAAFTQRTVSSTQIQLIGGKEFYRPVCRACYYSKNSSVQENNAEIKEIND